MEALRAENHALRQEVAMLRKRMAAAVAADGAGRHTASASRAADVPITGQEGSQNGAAAAGAAFEWEHSGHSLQRADIERYSRQLILPALGVQGQVRLKASSVLVIGAGGLGCPAVLYLAAAGVGRLGIVDRDAVELSNIHRQVAHSEAAVGTHKADSAAAAARALNSSIQVDAHRDGFTAANALALVRRYDIVIDASDNAPTRYLASDACVAAGKPLVSGAALGTDGQLTVYHHGADGPCYRCLFPVPPRADACGRCSDAGVLGPVPGVIGCLQALEAIKLAAGIGKPLSRQLLIVDALFGRFSTVLLRARSRACAACGDAPSVTAAYLSSFDYAAFTGQAADDAAPCARLLQPAQRLSATQLAARLRGGEKAARDLSGSSGAGSNSGGGVADGLSGGGGGRSPVGDAAGAAAEGNGGALPSRPPLLLDVRPADQFDMCRLPGSVNIPFDQLQRRLPEVKQLAAARANGGGPRSDSPEGGAGSCGGGSNSGDGGGSPAVVVLCRRGNDSQEAVQWLAAAGMPAVDLAGGLNGCRQLPESAFPTY